MLNKNRLNTIIVACSLSTATLAQTHSVESQVKGAGGQPIGGAIVSVVGDSISTLTKPDGTFHLHASSSEAIVSIQAEGYYSRTIPLRLLLEKQNADAFQITLVPDDMPFYNGKVETPHSSGLSRYDKTVMTVGIETKDYSQKLSVGAATRDQVAGLQVIEKSGMPGEGSYMNIRGIHTFVADNSPLIVINGVPYLGNNRVSDIINGYSRDMLFGYSPKDIRSISVLKGADAAMFGSLGSNGVVMIETQQATTDNLDTRISFSGQYGLNLSNTSIPMMGSTQYKNYLAGLGMTAYPSMASLREDYPFLQNDVNRYSYLFSDDTDWMDEIHHKGFMTENLFRVEGGDEIAKYNISFGYTSNGGSLRNTRTDRYHTLISSDVMVSRKIDITANVGLSYITSDLQNMGMRAEINPLISAQRAMPLLNPHAKQEDGSLLSAYAPYNVWNVSAIPTIDYQNVSNPAAIVGSVKGADKIYDANTGIGLHYKWNDHLTLSALLNLYYNYTEETMFIPGVSSKAIIPQVYGTAENQVANGVIRQSVNNYQLSAKYKRLFNKVHELNATATARAITRDIEYDLSEGFQTANDYYTSLNYTNSEKDIRGDNIKWNYMGMNLHGDYTYNRMLKGTVGLAIDGTSVSGDDASRFGFFPSAGITFMAANTGALPSCFDMLNFTLEGSLSGNSRFSSNYSKQYYVSSNFEAIGSIYRAGVPNRRLTWEKKRQVDFGLDAQMLGGRLDVSVGVYANESYDLLLNNNVSAVYGSQSFYSNRGKISGHGLELAFRANPIHTRDFDFVVAANITNLKSTVTSLGGDDRAITKYTGYAGDDAQMLMAVGETPYKFYGLLTNGIYTTTAEALADGLVNQSGVPYQAGDVRFVDINHDGIINDADRVGLGSTLPSVYGGINLMLRYRHLSLDANFGYTLGSHLYNAMRRDAESMATFYNQSTSVVSRWQMEGQQATLPRAAYGDPAGNNVFSDRWIEDGDYLKLRSLQLTYDFQKLFGLVRSGSVFVAAENLFCLTSYLGSDPEFAYSYDERLRGFDYAKAALPITLKLGFNLNF